MSMFSGVGVSVFGLRRAGALDANVQMFAKRSAAFSAAAAQLGGAVLLVWRTASGLSSSVVFGSGGRAGDAASTAAVHLAQAVGAEARVVDGAGGGWVLADELPDAAAGRVAWLRFRPGDPASRDSQQGADPAEVSRLVARSMSEGMWAAVLLRPASARERRAHLRWLEFRMQTRNPVHHSMSTDAVVVSVVAGGGDGHRLRGFLASLAAGLPGLDLAAEVGVDSLTGVRVRRAAAAVAGLGCGAVLGVFAGRFAEGLQRSLEGWAVAGGDPSWVVVFHTVAALLGVLGLWQLWRLVAEWVMGRASGWTDRLLYAIGSNRWPLPAHRWLPARAPRAEKLRIVDGVERVTAASSGDYPLPVRSALVGAEVVAGLVAPQSGALHASGGDVREVPPQVLAPVGPAVGSTSAGVVHLPASDAPMGLAVTGGPGTGKLLTLSTPIPTPAGWTSMGELSVGDLVFGRDGKPCRVTGVSGVNETPDLYRVTFADGQVILADADHQWVVSTRYDRKAHRKPNRVAAAKRWRLRSDQIGSLRTLADRSATEGWLTAAELFELITRAGVNVWGSARNMQQVLRFMDSPSRRTVRSSTRTQSNTGTYKLDAPFVEYPRAAAITALADRLEQQLGAEPSLLPNERLVCTYDMIHEGLQDSSGANRFAVAIPAALELPEKDFPIQPYALGLWLGDGSAQGNVFTTIEPHVVGALERMGYAPKLVTGCTKEYTTVGFLPRLRDAGIEKADPSGRSFDKRIPVAYLRGSREQRLELLRGLMDTDGTISTRGTCELSLSKKDLADDALELIRSLGIKASMTSGPTSYVGDDGVRVSCKDRHRIHFTTEVPVFGLVSKLRRVPGSVSFGQDWNSIVSIEPVLPRDDEYEPGRCITVDSPDSTYLAGKGFVPTHNTKLVTALWATDACDRAQPSGREGMIGSSNSMVFFDSKGDEVATLRRWAAVAGDRVVVVDVGDESTVGIDFFDQSGSASERAGLFLNAMVFAFGQSSIQGRSQEVLDAVLTGALVVDADVVAAAVAHGGFGAGVDVASLSPVQLAHILCGGRGDQAGVALYAGIAGEATRRGGKDPVGAQDLLEAAGKLAVIYQGPSESARRSLTEAARNKLNQLVSVPFWWAPGRRRVSWTRVLEDHLSVVVNLGRSATGRVVDDEVAGVLSSMMFYLLRNAIQKTCSGWQQHGRAVSIYSDELALIAGHSEGVMEWLRDQGRSYGVRLRLATQRPSQLPDKVRQAFLTMAALVSFKQEEVGAAADVAAQLGMMQGEWGPEDVLTLQPFTAAARLHVGMARMSAFVMRVPLFEGDMSASVSGWGYVPADAGVVSVPGPAAGSVFADAADAGDVADMPVVPVVPSSPMSPEFAVGVDDVPVEPGLVDDPAGLDGQGGLTALAYGQVGGAPVPNRRPQRVTAPAAVPVSDPAGDVADDEGGWW